MNSDMPKPMVSAPIIAQLAKQAANLVNEIGHNQQMSEKSLLPKEQQMLCFKGWAFSGWVDPDDLTSFPSFLIT